jgi:Tol biopolymer transport system component
MRRASRAALPLALVCLLVSCTRAASQQSAAVGPDPKTAIALSIPADGVYLVDPDSGEIAKVVDDLADYQAGFAAWAPDHRRLAFGNNGIFVLDTVTGSQKTLIRGRGLSMPTWSPDGGHLAYGDGLNLWVSPAEYLQAIYLHIPLELAPLVPAWQPGGDIAFQGLRMKCHLPNGCTSTDRSDIWTVKPDGEALNRVTVFDRAANPKWSPDGSRVLFIRRYPGLGSGGELWSARPDGSRMESLAEDADVIAADWSPDGRRLALVRPAGKGFVQVWVADSHGANPRPVGKPVGGNAATLDW